MVSLIFTYFLIPQRSFYLFKTKIQGEIIKFVVEDSDPLAIGAVVVAINAMTVVVHAT